MNRNTKFFVLTMISGAFVVSTLGLEQYFPLFFIVPVFVLSLLGYLFTVDTQ